MKKKTNLKKTKISTTYNLLMYVEENSARIKRFATKQELGKFVDEFYKKHPDYADKYSDNWVDYCVTDIKGDVHFFTDGLEVE